MISCHSAVRKAFPMTLLRLVMSSQRMTQVTVAEPSSSSALPRTSGGSSVFTQRPTRSKCSRMYGRALATAHCLYACIRLGSKWEVRISKIMIALPSMGNQLPLGPHGRVCFPYRFIRQHDEGEASWTPVDNMALIYWVFPNLVLAFTPVGVELIDIRPAGSPTRCT